jgi:hypothetical protein
MTLSNKDIADIIDCDIPSLIHKLNSIREKVKKYKNIDYIPEVLKNNLYIFSKIYNYWNSSTMESNINSNNNDNNDNDNNNDNNDNDNNDNDNNDNDNNDNDNDNNDIMDKKILNLFNRCNKIMEKNRNIKGFTIEKAY